MTSLACSRGRNVARALLDNSELFWGIASHRDSAARLGWVAGTTSCFHTSATPVWGDNGSRCNRAGTHACQIPLHGVTELRTQQRWASVTANQNDPKVRAKSEVELSDRAILSKLLVHIWPPDNLEFRGRVVGALALLGGSKLLNIQVCTEATLSCGPYLSQHVVPDPNCWHIQGLLRT